MEQENKKFWRMFISITIVLISWIILISLKLTTDIKLLIPTIVTIILTIVGIIASFAHKFFNRILPEQKSIIPEPISQTEIEEIIERERIKKWNNITSIKEKRVEDINKNEIHIYLIEMEFKELINDVPIYEWYFIINATYPQKEPTIIPANISHGELSRAINSASRDPKEDPDIIRKVTEDSLTGRTLTEEQILHRKKEEKEETVA